ncbi:ComF family protein [Candidatus Neomarinimicrobiota bacterium]
MELPAWLRVSDCYYHMWFRRLKLLDLLFPHFCYSCDEPADDKQAICISCLDNLEDSQLGNWSDRVSTKGSLSNVWSAFWYEEALQSLIHRLKYSGRRKIGPSLAQAVYRALDFEINWSEFGLIVPVPLHKRRKRKRGFNQASVIGEELSVLTGVPVNTEILTRIVNTPSQIGLDIEGRRTNVQGSFASRGPIDGGSILLVDDLLTTGATAAACASALIEAGAAEVSIITVATPKN